MSFTRNNIIILVLCQNLILLGWTKLYCIKIWFPLFIVQQLLPTFISTFQVAQKISVSGFVITPNHYFNDLGFLTIIPCMDVSKKDVPGSCGSLHVLCRLEPHPSGDSVQGPSRIVGVWLIFRSYQIPVRVQQELGLHYWQ